MKRLLLTFLIFLLYLPTASSQYYFGRNKVNYDNFDWHVLKTEHFDIYYYPEMQELAEIGAAYAEDAYQRLADKFDHNINNSIPLIFYSNHLHFQQTNVTPNLIQPGVGGFFEFLKGRVVIPANGSLYDFHHVINHELVHVFMHSKSNRTLKDHRKRNYTMPPLWFTEGLAEYWGEGWDSEAEMFIRDATIAGYLVPLSQMYRIYGTFLMYKEGQAICKFIAEKFGEEKLLQLIENLWMSDSFSEVMRLTLGVTYKEFDELWLYHLKKEKYPILDDNDMPGMVSQRLTREGVNTKPTYCQRDGKENLIFVSNRVGYSNIYSMPYSSFEGEENLEIVVKGERTSEFEAFNLLKSKIDANESGELAFVAKSKGKDAIYKLDLDTEEVLERLQFDEIVTIFSPNWSPDGDEVVFTGVNFSGKSDLYIYNFPEKKLKKLTNDFYDDRDPTWSPNGQFIAFSSDRSPAGKSGAYNLFLCKIETGDIVYLTFGDHKDLTPSWSPDGRAIVFTSDRDGAFNIWTMTLPPEKTQYVASIGGVSSNAPEAVAYPSALDQATELKKLTRYVTGAFDPEWTPDGSIVFTAFENFSFQLRRIENIEKKIHTTTAARADSLLGAPEPWRMPNLAGDSEISSFRYRKKFSLDIAQSQINQDPIFGTSGGAQLAFSDMLGNEQYYFLLYNTASNQSEILENFNVAVTKINLGKRTNTAYGLYHFAGNYYNFADGFFFERRYGGFASISYPLSVFRRIEANFNIRKSERRAFGLSGDVNGLLVSNFLSFTKDNSLWGATGPMDGERFSLSIGNTLDIKGAKTNFITLIADYRKYFRIGRQVSYATRFWTAMNRGKGADLYRFYMGGSWDLRLYPRWRIWGKNLFLVSQELRFPFIDRFNVAFPFGGIGFSAIRGALFVDLGNAWDDRLTDVLGAAGFGARLRFGGFLVLRYDVGRRFAVQNIDQGFSVDHIKVDPQWYHRFFFGWDF